MFLLFYLFRKILDFSQDIVTFTSLLSKCSQIAQTLEIKLNTLSQTAHFVHKGVMFQFHNFGYVSKFQWILRYSFQNYDIKRTLCKGLWKSKTSKISQVHKSITCRVLVNLNFCKYRHRQLDIPENIYNFHEKRNWFKRRNCTPVLITSHY